MGEFTSWELEIDVNTSPLSMTQAIREVRSYVHPHFRGMEVLPNGKYAQMRLLTLRLASLFLLERNKRLKLRRE